MGIFVKVSDNLISYDLYFNRRINFIIGAGGAGKTTLASLVDLANTGDYDISLDSSYPIRIYRRLDDIQTDIVVLKDRIILIDDLSFIEKPLFASLVKEYCVSNNLWFIIMTRESVVYSTLGARLSYSTNSVYKLVGDRNKTLAKYFNYKIDSSSNYDCFLTEDTNSGFIFFKILLGDKVFHSTSGKSTIIQDINEKISEGYKNILVILDTAAYGCHMPYFDALFSDDDSFNVSFISDYECFEELLCKSNIVENNEIIVKELSVLENYANNFVSWENYFEDLIKRATSNKLYSHSHSSKIKNCYLDSCDNCSIYKRQKCDFNKSGDKLENLLRDTNYEFLLSLRRF